MGLRDVSGGQGGDALGNFLKRHAAYSSCSNKAAPAESEAENVLRYQYGGQGGGVPQQPQAGPPPSPGSQGPMPQPVPPGQASQPKPTPLPAALQTCGRPVGPRAEAQPPIPGGGPMSPQQTQAAVGGAPCPARSRSPMLSRLSRPCRHRTYLRRAGQCRSKVRCRNPLPLLLPRL